MDLAIQGHPESGKVNDQRLFAGFTHSAIEFTEDRLLFLGLEGLCGTGGCPFEECPCIGLGPGIGRPIGLVVGGNRNGQNDGRRVGPEVEEKPPIAPPSATTAIAPRQTIGPCPSPVLGPARRS